MLILYHIMISPFAEKARWALAYKQLEHQGRLLFPGLHARSVQRLAGTRTVPLLVATDTGEQITDSTAILQYLERIAPEPPLFPGHEAARQRTLKIEDWLDEHAARPVARFLYAHMVDFPPVFFRYMSTGLSARQRALGWLVRPLLPRIIRGFRASRELTPETVPVYREGIVAACDRIEAWLDEAGGDYLVGDSFTAADLTAASLLAPLVQPPGSPWARAAAATYAIPGWPPDPVDRLRREVRARRVGAWVLETWRRHR